MQMAKKKPYQMRLQLLCRGLWVRTVFSGSVPETGNVFTPKMAAMPQQ
jgi:hypothetical protein